MAIFELELTNEQKEALRGQTRLDVNGLMNWIIWGNREGIINVEQKHEHKGN